MKELEKLIPKRCAGISPMIVKELVQQMIDEDGLICVEKCGNINVYWCFKNQIKQKIYDDCKRISKVIETRTVEINEMKDKLNITNETQRCPQLMGTNGEILFSRKEQLQVNNEIVEETKKLQIEYNKISQIRWNKQTIEDKRRMLSMNSGTLEIITDNIEILVGYLCKRFNIEPRQLRKELEIPEEFEEITI